MTAPLTSAPRLTTERLILRGPELEDLAPLTEWITTSDRMAIMGGNGTVTEARYAFLVGIGRWHLDGFGYFTLTPMDTPTPMGRVGLLSYPVTDTEPHPAVELAWHLFDGFEGLGYATEAAAAVRDWARRDRGLGRLVSYIDPANAPSQRVARRLGANTDGTRAGHDPDAEVWVHGATA